jgi:ankyrin repeat protein
MEPACAHYLAAAGAADDHVDYAVLARITIEENIRSAARDDDTDEIQRLIDGGGGDGKCDDKNVGGVDVNATDRFGMSALCYAAATDHPNSLKLLLSHSGDVAMRDKDGDSVLLLACRNGSWEAASFLLSDALTSAQVGYRSLFLLLLFITFIFNKLFYLLPRLFATQHSSTHSLFYSPLLSC